MRHESGVLRAKKLKLKIQFKSTKKIQRKLKNREYFCYTWKHVVIMYTKHATFSATLVYDLKQAVNFCSLFYQNQTVLSPFKPNNLRSAQRLQ